MSNNELLKQWKQSVAEFGERAHERFTHKGMAFYDENVSSNKFAEAMLKLNNLKIKPISDLWNHDVQVYVDDAHLMWEYYDWLVRDNLNNRVFWVSASSNDDINNCISGGWSIRRKESAALPFDLERSKAGDIVEWRNDCDDTWDTCEFVTESNDNGFFEIISSCGIDKKYVLACELRMKYPKKVNYE